jgi:hypothetical protein
MAAFTREQLVAVAELVLKAKGEFPDVDPSDLSIQEDLILQKSRSYHPFKFRGNSYVDDAFAMLLLY